MKARLAICADGEKGGVELARLHRFENVVDLAVENDIGPPCRRRAAFRRRGYRAASDISECQHHAANHWAGVMDRNAMPSRRRR